MSKRKRANYTAEFKARVCIEAIKEELTLSELAAKYEVHSNLISKWKKEFLERAGEIFKEPKQKKETDNSKLYQQIGELKVENDWIKKKLGILERM
jgi:transposase-like protein